MRTITIFLIGTLIFLFGCQKDPEVANIDDQPKSRLKVKNQVIRVVPAAGLKTFQTEPLGFIFTLVAEVDAPVIVGQTVQATHVAIEGNLALVSYNMRGPQNLGALDIIDITNPAAPFIVKSIEFIKDINTVGWYNELIVLAGQDSNGAFFGFIDPADDENNLEVFRLPSHSAVGMTVNDDLIYVVSAKAGGLTIIDAEGSQEFMPYFDARSVAVNEDVFVLTKENIFVLDGGTIPIDPGYVQNASKAELEVSSDYLFAALNRGGAHIYDAENLSLVQAIPRPATPDGSDPENYVTNSVSFNDPLLLLANGGAGIAVNKRVWNQGTEQDEFLEFGYFDFGGPLSSNFVKSRGNFIFVATGLGGLKILTFFEEEECNWTMETAFAGSDAGGGAAWWYYFDTASGSTHPIYAGRNLVEGAYVQYLNGIMTIELGPNMMLRNVPEAVKIQGYNEGELPSFRPPSGLFTTYKGNDLVIEIPYYPYYVIHLDVMICNRSSK